MATTRNKVMWQEGMLMRPHHFQQQQRYNDPYPEKHFRQSDGGFCLQGIGALQQVLA